MIEDNCNEVLHDPARLILYLLITLRMPLKTSAFDGLKAILKFRVLDNILIYLRNAEEKEGFLERPLKHNNYTQCLQYFSKSYKMTIPKIIHQLWIPSKDTERLPSDIQENIDTIKRTHPEYSIKLWNLVELEKNFSKNGNHTPGSTTVEMLNLNLMEALCACRFPAMISDIVRLAVIYEYGGFWNDLKNYYLDSFLDKLTAIEKPIFVEHPPMENDPDPKDRFCNAFIGAKSKDKFIYLCLEEAIRRVQNRMDKGGVYGTTGGSLIMHILRKNTSTEGCLPIHPLRHKEFWNVRIRRTAASYNKGDQHWSILQKTESLYL